MTQLSPDLVPGPPTLAAFQGGGAAATADAFLLGNYVEKGQDFGPLHFQLELGPDHRHALKEKARELLGAKYPQLIHCQERLIKGQSPTITRNSKSGKAKFSGFQTCQMNKSCPDCARSNACKQHRRVSKALLSTIRKGYQMLFVTLTAKFAPGMDQKRRIDVLQAALESLRDRVDYKRFKALGYVGDIRRFEVSFDEQYGLNPHFHVIFVFQQALSPVQLGTAEELLRKAWSKSCTSKGLMVGPFNGDYGVHVRNVDELAAWYLTKSPMMLTEESQVRLHGLTPGDLLNRASKGDWKAAVAFQDYAMAIEKRQVLRFSHGLESALGLDQPTGETGVEELVIKLDRNIYREICDRRLQSVVLKAAEEGGKVAVEAVLAWFGLCIKDDGPYSQ